MAVSFAFRLFAAGAILGALLFAMSEPRDISIYMLTRQDTVVLALGALLLFVLRERASGFTLPCIAGRERAFARAAALGVAAVCYAGAHLVALKFPLSLDEFMAVFDAGIFRGGHLLAPLPAEWRAYADALQPIFLLDAAEAGVWASTYLPVNAAFHAFFPTLGDRALTAPVLAAITVLALYGVARRLWPERKDAAAIAVVLLITSSQFVITAMTPYAMTAHLALNLVWLWLFLRNTGASHGGAFVVGFAASGLHQVVFHPLFVAPFVLRLWLDRRYRLALLYTLGYGAICLFWVLYWRLLLPAAGGEAPGISAFISRALDMLRFDLAALGLMVRNLARFIAWQNPFALVLLIVALGSARRWARPLPELWGGIVLTVIAMTVLMPFQGHGWGYRYLHGLLGNLSLIAAFGWIGLSGQQAAPMRVVFAACTAFAAFSIPLRAWQVWAFTAPYAAAYEKIRTTDADIVIVDPTDIWYGGDLVRNDPYLRNRPKVMVLNRLREADIAGLCAQRRIAIFDRKDADRFGIRATEGDGSAHNAHLRAVMAAQGCGSSGPGASR